MVCLSIFIIIIIIILNNQRSGSRTQGGTDIETHKKMI